MARVRGLGPALLPAAVGGFAAMCISALVVLPAAALAGTAGEADGVAGAGVLAQTKRSAAACIGVTRERQRPDDF